MTDSLTPRDLQRMEAWVEMNEPKDREALDKRIDTNKYFPKTLKSFLKKEMGKNYVQHEHRKEAEKRMELKGTTILSTWKITEFNWRPNREMKAAMKSIAIRDEKGRFKSWFILK